jgi:quercetin dioxygenase-like cupin family protein
MITRSGSLPSSAGPAEFFTGEVHVDPLFPTNETAAYGGAYVTFQAGARSAWHTHPAGQRLVVIRGTGRTQQWGGPVEELREGDVVWCPPGVKHWHGAAPDSMMTHLALTGVNDDGTVDWLEKVTDEEYAGGARHAGPALDARRAGIATIAAFTARGDQPRLTDALNAGLDAGLTINEIKEVLVQMYAYAGFPRSLNGIATFMTVLTDREERGIKDDSGPEPTPRPATTSSLDLGTRNQTTLIGTPAAGAYLAFAPAIDQFLKAHLFGDIFGRDNLDFADREIATIAALASLDGLGGQLRGHLAIGLNIGLKEQDLKALIAVIRAEVDPRNADTAEAALTETLTARNN